MNIGDIVPPTLRFKATSHLDTNFDHYRGQWIVLYFYPKDATPGCTIEGCQFRDDEKHFAIYNATILGVSRDNLTSHEKFKANKQFPFELISDEDGTLCKTFDVIKTKSFFGKQIIGIQRSTFLIDPTGVVRHIWRKVSVKNHVQEVLETLKQLQSS